MRLDLSVKLQEINDGLKRAYGIHTVANLQNFRVSYVGDQFETREGEFNVYIEGTDVFLRTEKGIRRVQKYGNMPDDSLVLERLIGNLHKDVMEGEWIYDPLYNFPEGMVPPLRAYVFLINNLCIMGGARQAPANQKEAEERDAIMLAQAKTKTREFLDTEFDYTDISMRLKHGAAVTDFNSKIDKGLEKGKVVSE